MATLSIDDQVARKLYPTAAPEFKAILENSYPVGYFTGKITDRIKTFEDACSEVGEDPEDDKFEEGAPDEIAFKKIKVIVRALNEGWTPDWNNNGQYKWSPWFYLNSPGFRFSFSLFSHSASYSASGSRLCFKSEELATYAGKTFLSLYQSLIV